MANKYSLLITSTDTNNKQSNKTITNIRPTANSATVKEFAQGLVSLTSNTYDDSAIIDRIETSQADLPIHGGTLALGGRPDSGVLISRDTPGITYDATNKRYEVTVTVPASNSYVTHSDGVYEMSFFVFGVLDNDGRGRGFAPYYDHQYSSMYGADSSALYSDNLNQRWWRVRFTDSEAGDKKVGGLLCGGGIEADLLVKINIDPNS